MNVKPFLALVGKHRPKGWIIAAAIILGLGETALSLFIPLLTRDVVEEASASALQSATVIMLGAVFALQTAMSGFGVYTMSYVGQYMVAGLRREVWERVLRLPVSFFDRNTSGETMSRITNDTNVIKDFIVGHVISFLGGIVSIVGGVGILLYLDWRMTLLMLIAVPASLLILWPLGSKMFAISKSMQDETAMFQGDLGRVLTEIRLVKSSLAEPAELRQGRGRIGSLFRFGMKEAKIMSIVTPLMMSIMLLILVLLIGYGGVRVAQGTITTGELVAIILYMFQIVMPFTQMASFFTQFQKALGASQRIIELIEEPAETERGIDDRPANQQRGRRIAASETISFEKVSFAYSPDRPILNGVSFEAVAGGMTAFVGASGAGKTTIFSLVERFYSPTGGTIRYGADDVSAMSLQQWRDRLAYVSQESPMMAGSIRHNLTYGLSSDVSEERIAEALEGANLAELIASLPDGLETEVGERGVKLSGGQRQRLAIARAMLRDPEFLLLDEATAHLDSESERLVQDALQKLMQGRTTLVIAHRLSTVSNADRIIVLEKGEVTGQGTHMELLRSHELYVKLAKGQHLESEAAV
ncbi:ABC transporter ATP-binding protein [Paenibacillus agaridevorans]|uniref:ABC transporter ATP-binding protein n=1 Tax=Paenibacillus agaridevorans TaxID=171404 RepID=UPI001BE46954|nr:ABC transporter ATP-binding protein [Paenibacillus agaridevorans]